MADGTIEVLKENVTNENYPERWNPLITITFAGFVAANNDVIISNLMKMCIRDRCYGIRSVWLQRDGIL